MRKNLIKDVILIYELANYEVIEKLSELRGLVMIHFAEKSVQNA